LDGGAPLAPEMLAAVEQAAPAIVDRALVGCTALPPATR
jgi:hypothetical protein